METKMSGRLILAVVSTILEEAALAVIVLVGLPELGIKLHLAVLIVLMLAWAVIAILNYQAGSRALKRQPVAGLGTMVGSRGRVVKPLQPEGLIKVGGELWQAKSVGPDIDSGNEVIVVGQDRKILIVRHSS
jgi:membrane-bound serine protease (ClpP class)